MTTFTLLALHDDGRSEAFTMPMDFGIAFNTFISGLRKLQPTVVGYDRNPYSTYEVAGFSIDVLVMTAVKRTPEEILAAYCGCHVSAAGGLLKNEAFMSLLPDYILEQLKEKP